MNLPMVSRKRFKALQVENERLRTRLGDMRAEIEASREPLAKIIERLVQVSFPDMKHGRLEVNVEFAPDLLMSYLGQREIIAHAVADRVRLEILGTRLLPFPPSPEEKAPLLFERYHG
jgi:hypothetical protein